MDKYNSDCHYYIVFLLRISLLILLFHLACFDTEAQRAKAKLDSLRRECAKTSDPSKKYDILKYMCKGFDFTGNYKARLDTSFLMQNLASQMKSKDRVVHAYQERFQALWRLSKFSEAKKTNDSAYALLVDKKKPGVLLSGIYLHYNLIFTSLGNPDSSIYYGLKAVQIDSLINAQDKSSAINALAISYMSKNDFVKANTYFFKALKLAQESKDHILEGRCLINIGAVYTELKNYQLAKLYTQQCYEMRKKTENIQGLAAVLGNLGDICFLEDDYPCALEKYRASIFYAKKAQFLPNLLSAFGNISETFSKLNQSDSALHYAKELVNLCETREARNQISAAYRKLGNRFKDSGDLVSARSAYEKSLYYADLYPTYRVRGAALSALADVSEKLGDYQSATLFLKKSRAFDDSLFSEKNNKSIAKLELDFQTEKKDKEIALQRIGLKEKETALLQKEKALLQSNASLLESRFLFDRNQKELAIIQKTSEIQELNLNKARQEVVSKTLEAKAKAAQLELAEKDKAINEKELKDEIFIRNSIVFAILVGLIIAYLLFNRFRLKQQIAHQQTLLDQRKRLSADLHDDVGATLSSISIYTEAIKNKLKNNEPEKVMELVAKIGENSRETISTLGDIVWNLNPINDSAEKLFNRMESTATLLLTAQNTTLDFYSDPHLFGIEFSLDAKQNLYLIYKEVINNTSKYAQAKEVKVSIRKIAAELVMEIKDDGVGFNLENQTEGNGLRNIRIRTKALNGLASISSSSKGTQTEIRLPLTHLEK